MEVHPDRTIAGGIPVRWCMWCRAYITLAMHTNGSCHSFCRYCRSQIPHSICRERGSNIINYTTRATQTYREDQGNYNPYERDIKAKQRLGQNLPADPHAVRVVHTAPLNDWFKGWPRTHKIWSKPAESAAPSATSTITATTASVQQQRLQRTTDTEFMGEKNFNRTRRSRRKVSTVPTTNVTTTSASPGSTSSNSVQIVPPPPPTVIDLTVESIEDLMMADVQEQKAASGYETSTNQPKATKGKRKHMATGKSRGRPQKIQARIGIVTRVKDWHDYRLLQPRPRIQAHVRRPSTIDVVLHVCGTMVDVPIDVLVSVSFDV